MRAFLIVSMLVAGISLASAQGMKLADDMSDPSTTGSLGTQPQDSPRISIGNTSVQLSSEQKSTIRASVLTANAPRIGKKNFVQHLGSVVPRNVRLGAMPNTLVEVHPGLRGYLYFVAGDGIVVVEPGTKKIIALIEV